LGLFFKKPNKLPYIYVDLQLGSIRAVVCSWLQDYCNI